MKLLFLKHIDGRVALTLLLFSYTSVASFAQESTSPKHSFIPPEGFVPNETVAKQIAEAIWIPIYGEEVIRNEKPFVATLENGTWIVQGSLSKGNIGGVAIAEIAKNDGHVVRISHGQ